MQRFTVPLLLALSLGVLIWLTQSGVLNLYWQSVLMYIGINVMLATSLNLVNGNMGEFSCGHAGFMAVGAYVSSIVTVMVLTDDKAFGFSLLGPTGAIFFFPVALLIGGAAAAVVGLLVAFPSFKTRGDYLAIITIAASYIVKSTIENINAIGGARGFMGMANVTKSMEKALNLPWMVIWVFLGAVFTIWCLRRFLSSTYGKGVDAINQDEIAAEIMSVNTNKMKLIAFMLSSGLAGVAGGLYAHVIGYVNPGSFTIMKSTEVLVMVYLGGMGSISGATIAAVLFTLMMEGLRFVFPALNSFLHWSHLIPDNYEVSQVWKWVMIPLMLFILMHIRPEGLMGNRELSSIFPRLKKFYSFK
jgi:branched-chain amino acid transport system permease protein